MMNAKIARDILLSLICFLGLGAVFGGMVLIISPAGKLFGMPLSLLRTSPFNNFLIPGIILFTVLGVVPILTVVALIKKPVNRLVEKFNLFQDMHWAWTFSIYSAFALIIWIQAEMYFLQAVHWAHSLYMFIALAIILVALLPPIRNLYKKE